MSIIPSSRPPPRATMSASSWDLVRSQAGLARTFLLPAPSVLVLSAGKHVPVSHGTWSMSPRWLLSLLRATYPNSDTSFPVERKDTSQCHVLGAWSTRATRGRRSGRFLPPCRPAPPVRDVPLTCPRYPRGRDFPSGLRHLADCVFSGWVQI